MSFFDVYIYICIIYVYHASYSYRGDSLCVFVSAYAIWGFGFWFVNLCHNSHRFLHTCLVLLSDKSELLLFATQLRLQLQLSTFGVPTPPVQAYLPLAVGQGGGFWDDVDSRSDPLAAVSSASSSEHHAMEEQNTHGI